MPARADMDDNVGVGRPRWTQHVVNSNRIHVL